MANKSKEELRRKFLQMRKEIGAPTLSRQMCEHLYQFLKQRGLREIMIYLPFRNEPSPLPLLELYPEANYYLPRISLGFLTVHPYSSPREKHPFGLEQPAAGSPVVGEESLEAVIVPGLAFDRAGYRLGYGGGYYDGFLAELPPNVFTIGLVPKELIVDQLPRDEWDVPVNWLANQQGVQPAALTGI